MDDQILDRRLDDGQVRCLRQLGLHGFAIELAVDLRARASHGRPLGAVQHLVLDTADIGHPPHQAVERIDLTHQVALAQAANRRVARHLAKCRRLVRQQQCLRAHARRSRRGFTAGVSATNNNDIPEDVRGIQIFGHAGAIGRLRSAFHVKHHLPMQKVEKTTSRTPSTS